MSGLAVLFALLAGPLVQYLAASQPAMACCKRSRHACCKRKAQAKPGKSALEAAPPCGTTCAKCCQASPSSSPIVAARAPHVVAWVQQLTPLLLAGTGDLRPVPRSTSLFQRPPPAFLSC